MAYTNVNFYKRVLKVQEIYLLHKPKGLSNRAIFKKYVRDNFIISEATFYNYLAINAKAKLAEFQNTN